jgi:hypothetical protein
MAFSFRPAARESVSLLISLAGQSGSGKTWSAMLLAKGLAEEKRFVVLDTEAGRSRHYADFFSFDVGDITPPFTPDAYTAAIKAADAAHYPVIVIDSFSHSWAGEGGVLDMHEAELQRMAGDDWKKREAMKMSAWVKPKVQMKAMIQRLLQVRAHLIFCLRAEQKIDMTRGADGKMVIAPKQSLSGLDGWIPICSKEFPFEMTASFLLTADKPGVPRPIKLQEQHRPFFHLDQPITEDSGARLAVWAKGGTAPVSVGSVRGTIELDDAFTSKLQAATTALADGEDWLTVIKDARTEAELVAVGDQLKAASGSIPDATLKKLRAAYAAKLKAVTAAGATA